MNHKINIHNTGWRELDEAFAGTRKLLGQIKRDNPKIYQEAIKRHTQEKNNQFKQK